MQTPESFDFCNLPDSAEQRPATADGSNDALDAPRLLRFIKNFLATTFLWILLTPVGFIILGAASNQAVVIANHGAMPVLLNDARVKLRDSTAEVNGVVYLDPRHTVMTAQSHLKILADIIDMGKVESVGDLSLDFGEWLWTFAPMVWGVLVCLRLLSQSE